MRSHERVQRSPDTSAEPALFGLVGLLVLGAALYVVKRGPWLTAFAVVLALPVRRPSDGSERVSRRFVPPVQFPFNSLA